MLRALASLLDESGQTLAEYGLISTLIGVGVTVAALLLFNTALANAYDAVRGCLSGTC